MRVGSKPAYAVSMIMPVLMVYVAEQMIRSHVNYHTCYRYFSYT